jgi:hypothetical protein
MQAIPGVRPFGAPPAAKMSAQLSRAEADLGLRAKVFATSIPRIAGGHRQLNLRLREEERSTTRRPETTPRHRGARDRHATGTARGSPAMAGGVCHDSSSAT